MQVSLPSYSSVSHVSTSNQSDYPDAPDPESSHDHESFLSHHENKRSALQPISVEVCIRLALLFVVQPQACGDCLIRSI